jgi:hypothetical protein
MISKRKECESWKNVILLNKIQKQNENFCLYHKEPCHFARYYLKKKSDEKDKTYQ